MNLVAGFRELVDDAETRPALPSALRCPPLCCPPLCCALLRGGRCGPRVLVRTLSVFCPYKVGIWLSGILFRAGLSVPCPYKVGIGDRKSPARKDRA